MSSRTCALNIALEIREFLLTFYSISSLSWLVLLIQNIPIKWKIIYCILNSYRYSASNCSQIKKNQLTSFHVSGLRNHHDWDFSKFKLYSIQYMSLNYNTESDKTVMKNSIPLDNQTLWFVLNLFIPIIYKFYDSSHFYLI